MRLIGCFQTGNAMLKQFPRPLNYPIGPAEFERCEALRNLGILDTLPDKNFDAAVKLARSSFDVPVALVALLDEQREWFKAVTGWDVIEAPRELALCNYTINQDDVFVVEDAELDARFASNPLVTGEPRVRFYAGVPIGLNDEHHLGTLCIIDTKPRAMTEKDVDLLRTLGDFVSNLLRQFHQDKVEQRLTEQLGVEREEHAVRVMQLRDKQVLLECASELAAIGSWDYNHATGQIVWGPETRQILDLAPNEDVTIDGIRGLFIGEFDAKWRREILGYAASGNSLLFEGKIRTRNGEEKWVRVLGKTENNGDTVNKFGLLQDITRERKTQERMNAMVERDSLTDIPNRFSLLKQLRKHQRDTVPFAFAMLDIDNFKAINDTFGHSAGDKCLKRIARKLTALEASGAFVARIAGDEFAIILPTGVDRRQLDRRVAKIVESLSFPMRFQEQTLNLTISMGITTHSAGTTFDPDALIAEADLALYEAKIQGRNRHAFFRAQMKFLAEEKAQTIVDIRNALRSGELELFYQMKLFLSDGSRAGFEALLRWRKKDGSVATPESFRPALEDPVLAGEITRFVVRSALDQAREWIDRGDRDVSISINVGPHQFRDMGFSAFLLAEIKQRCLPASAIEIEVTEDVFIGRDAGEVLKACQKFTEQGLRISFDDFGTGFASLTHLLDFPVRAIKIDRSFVSRLGAEERAGSFLKAVCDLAHSLSIEVVAEGIETMEQSELLRSIGCDYGQGYLFHRPSPARDITPDNK